jgi:tRNA pseudouridine38-40 synthase
MPDKLPMRYFIEVCYNGNAFHGSQIQGELLTVQGTLNKALSTLLRRPVETFGASRTDEGVHALSNMYHFDEEQSLHSQFRYKLNAILPHTMSVQNIYTSTKEEANARFDATSRRYRYRIYKSKNPFLYERALFYPFAIDRDILNKTAGVIKEYHDFETFSKRNTQSFTFLCTIFQSYWEEIGDELHYVVEANRFLRGMVRALVGTQLQVARGKHTLEEFRKIIEAKDCTNADFSVTGHGLYLEAVNYPEGYLVKLDLK